MASSEKTIDEIRDIQRRISAKIESSEDALFNDLEHMRRGLGVDEDAFDSYLRTSEYGTDAMVDAYQCWRDE